MNLLLSFRPRTAAILLALAALAAKPAFAAPPGFAFLEIPAGARATALGGAFASIGTGTEAAFWNPAGLAAIEGLEVSAGHSELVEKLRHDYFVVGGKWGGGGVSGSVRALYSEPIEERDEIGTLIGSFGAYDLEFAFGYGRAMSREVRAGVTAQVLRERIANLAATTFGLGFGATWEPASLAGLRVGLAAQNLGPAAHYTIDGVRGAPVTLPGALQGGVSYALALGARTQLRTAVETRVTRGRSGVGLVGAELSDASGAALRAGFRVNDDASSFSAGGGYGLTGFRLDYAFVPFRLDLGDTHRFSFSARF